MGKNLTRQLLKERIASGEFAEEKKDNTVKPKNETPLQPGQKKHLLNPRAYKDHIKARHSGAMYRRDLRVIFQGKDKYKRATVLSSGRSEEGDSYNEPFEHLAGVGRFIRKLSL